MPTEKLEAATERMEVQMPPLARAESNGDPLQTSSKSLLLSPPLSRSGHSSDAAPESIPNTSWSMSSDKQLGDRVFPVRSVVRVDSTLQQGRTSTEIHEGASLSSPTTQTYQERDKAAGSANHSPRDFSGSYRPVLDALQSDEEACNVAHGGSPSGSTVSTSHNRTDKYKFVPAEAIFSGDTLSENSTANSSLKGPSTAEAPRKSSVSIRSTADAKVESSDGAEAGFVTARFQHLVTAEGHAIVTGRDGETLQRCEDEPIHIPGAVQGFGLLIALEEQDEGNLVARVVSENSEALIGYSPADLFRLQSFTDILSEEQQDNLLDHIDFIRDDETDPASNGPEVFTLSIQTKRPTREKRSTKLWCAMHVNPTSPNLIICEFELDNDLIHPLVPSDEGGTPATPEDTLDSIPTDEEYLESTLNMSKPLRVLRSARKRKGEAAAMEVFNIMSQVQEQLANANTLADFLKILVGVVKELTGFHRVMCYQFDNNFNGKVVTELVDPRATKDLYKGLNFPASDIPKQAREMYKLNKVRLLYDRDLQTARLVCRTVQDLEKPLDLTYSYLRAMSPIHIKYLANMAVRSSMSISINAFGELWGLLACHTYGPKGMRVSFPIRKMCRLVGDTASRNIERLSYASRLQARKLINTMPTQANPSGYIIASSNDLLKLFDADYGLLSIRGETKILGKLGNSQEALAVLEYLRMRGVSSVVTSQDINNDFRDLRYLPGFKVIAGLLVVPLSNGGEDFIVFFRAGQIREVKWAGNPYEKFVKAGTEGFLEPRKSFKTWSETIVGQCREWTEEQVETAAVLCLVYGKFIEVWRQKEAAMQGSQLNRLLLANSAHEVRTPLNAIINYLEIALEGSIDQETRENLSKSHSASKSLIYVINDLLDLTKTEEGNELIKDEVIDFLAMIREATDPFKKDASRKGLEFNVIVHPGLPKLVHGDERRVRQAIANLVANAIQNTQHGWVQVDVWLQEFTEAKKATIEVVVADSGVGMSNEKLDALFRELEQVSTDGLADHQPNGLAVSLLGDQEQPTSAAGGATLGLGLATVARVVRNMDGQLRLKSEEGQGSRFVIQLPFPVPEPTPEHGESAKMLTRSAMPMQSPLTDVYEGEVTLIEKGSSARQLNALSRMISKDDLQSFKSVSSANTNKSHKSDVDRLIDAISGSQNTSDDSGTMLEEEQSSDTISQDSIKTRRSLETLPRPDQGSWTEKSNKLVGLKIPQAHLVGKERVEGNVTPLSAIKVPDQDMLPNSPSPPRASRISFGNTERPPIDRSQSHKSERMQTLVAEDDPINSRIIKKRLEKAGHEVHLTVNGEDCASAYGDRPGFFDVVLMDMQMPIVDGLTATKMIRSLEMTNPTLSARAAMHGRVPIIAVSASLVEREIDKYIEAGFDGWLLKPIDFKRLGVLMEGIVDEKIRDSCLYEAGQWERGGWFRRDRQRSPAQASNTPSSASV